MGSMLTAELVAPHEFRLAQHDLPDPGPGEVQVRVEAVGICGSDIHWFADGGIGDTRSIYPMILGHEPSGTVIKTGAGVTGWSPGDRAFLEPALYCYECRFCRSGHHNVCEKIRFASNPGIPGFFRERANLPARNLLAVPPTLSMGLATVVEPLAIALHSLNLGAVQKDESVAVYGAGPIGLLTIAALKLAGAGRVFAVEPVEHRRAMARHMGADDVFDPAHADEIQDVDCAMDCAAKEDTINQAFRAVRNAGRVLLTGIHSDAVVPFEVSHMRRKEIALYNVRRSNHESGDALRILTEHTKLFAPMVTHERPLDRIADGFEIVEHYADGVGKLVITPPASR
jgi:L-iditol 2-dehydrogenase